MGLTEGGLLGVCREPHPEASDSLMVVVPWTERPDSGGLGAKLTFALWCWAIGAYQNDQAGNLFHPLLPVGMPLARD